MHSPCYQGGHHKKNLSPGCLIALIIAGGLGLIILIHVAITVYFLMTRFEFKEVEFPESHAEASVVAPLPVKVTSSDGAYVRDGSEQLYGYYWPKTRLVSGQYVIAEIALGQQSEFSEIKTPGDIGPWAPVMITIVDTAKPEESGEYPSNRFSVLPAAYSVVDSTITFKGQKGPAGDIAFSGAIDLDKVRRYIELGEASTETVMTGDLTMNGEVLKDVEFTYFPGD